MLLHHEFIRTAKRNPAKRFITDRTTGQKLTYSRALVGALVLARRFRRYERGFIGIMVPTSAGCILSVVAAVLSGRVPVMVNYATGATNNAIHAQKLCGFRTVVTSRALLDRLACEPVDGMVFLEDIVASVSAVEKLLALLRSKLPRALMGVHGGSDDENLLVLFTSGSEKDPKAVPLTHRNVSANIESVTAAFELKDDDVFLADLPLFHVFGQTITLWLPVVRGLTVVTYANPLEYGKVCAIIRTERPTIVVGTPSFYRGYLRRAGPGSFESVRLAVVGADRCPDRLREGFLEQHDLVLLEGYGVTEASPVISSNTHEANRPGSVGRPVPGVEVRIEDLETGEACNPGETGRILVRGESIMREYLNDVAETAKSFRGGWYDTGDLGYMDDEGYLWHAGRLRRFVKVGGETVSLVRVESVLQEILPEDIMCCVVGVPDAVRGTRIIAAITGEVDRRKVLRLAGQRLPRIALPKEFVLVDELPEIAGGKVDFRAVTTRVREIIESGGD